MSELDFPDLGRPAPTPVPENAPVAADPGGPDDSPRSELLVGGAIIAAFFVLFLGWAAFAPLDAGAFASGQVAVSGNRQAVQHRDGGVVSALHVAEGDSVEAGQIQLEVAGGELAANERGLTGQVVALLAQRARLEAERNGRGSITTPPEFAGMSPGDRALADEAMTLQRQQFAARRSGRTTERGVLTQRISQLQQQVEGYRRQLEANAEQKRLIEDELADVRRLAEQGYAPISRVRALERQAAALDGEAGALRAEIARANEAMGEARLQMSGVGTDMDEDVTEQLRAVEVQLNELQPRLAEVRAQIERNRVRAPVSGQVVGLTIFTPGGVIQGGQTLMEIVPSNASQVIVARINPNDIDNLRVGLLTEVKFPGLRTSNPPVLRGRVERISADSFTEEGSNNRYFRAEIVVSPEELAKLGRGADSIRSGSPVEVVIVLRRRTLLQYIIEPLARGLWRTGSEL
ncbi:MAG: HlyD family type I secretion periplasmic adaptor subunit [Brevundimonas sp.]|uniref:HlyD family type I secretion periplasmic adaptor subunit n=1 Tax=Brevundimonas sp. TaxID=1871086 RepID=UPI00273767A4|nr:HlyD family type I secretion periplasmic adaptor subunit [Brevundimonas sp.]MDP3377242.1 HlyD family type I secretion periplasmic adaptor subunit [Brevundimonas sp.]